MVEIVNSKIEIINALACQHRRLKCKEKAFFDVPQSIETNFVKHKKKDHTSNNNKIHQRKINITDSTSKKSLPMKTHQDIYASLHKLFDKDDKNNEVSFLKELTNKPPISKITSQNTHDNKNVQDMIPQKDNRSIVNCNYQQLKYDKTKNEFTQLENNKFHWKIKDDEVIKNDNEKNMNVLIYDSHQSSTKYQISQKHHNFDYQKNVSENERKIDFPNQIRDNIQSNISKRHKQDQHNQKIDNESYLTPITEIDVEKSEITENKNISIYQNKIIDDRNPKTSKNYNKKQQPIQKLPNSQKSPIFSQNIRNPKDMVIHFSKYDDFIDPILIDDQHELSENEKKKLTKSQNILMIHCSLKLKKIQ
ncbi:hypothetical protein TRFO_01539 [Tritrichomonas foetus]|uniref:Uncharacterized protein n=1 Tax=Tritrichomonas foetus TaxID=1144522 RepID=A0A1J4JYR0_9EUKA|nr:hypothetical protein TRFO_01539 [Tritrichomonas foetus]|eukprot:OHT03834.1 hypothetical protein TRFO_01539 [Tritrichomonas foetus]